MLLEFESFIMHLIEQLTGDHNSLNYVSLDLVQKNCSMGSKEFGALSVDDPKATWKHGVEVVDPLKLSFQMIPFVLIADQLRQCHI